MNRITRVAVISGLVLGLGATGAAAATATATPDDSPTSQPVTRNVTSAADRQAEHRKHLVDDLAPLVANGTITQAQADTVADTLAAKAPRGRHPGHDGEREGGPDGGPDGGRRAGAEAAAATIGMTPEQLREELHSGKSIAQVAQAKGVDVQKVIDAMVGRAKQHLDEEVADGSLTQEQADQRLAEITQRITDKVNGTNEPR